GKVVMGLVEELTDKGIALKLTDGSVEDFDKDRLKSVKVMAGAAPAPAASGRRRGGSEAAAPAAAPAANTKSTNEPGVSVGARIRELIIGDMAMTEKD